MQLSRRAEVLVTSRMPECVAELADELAAMPGTVAVVLGGSHAIQTNHNESDWDLGLYYRGDIDLTSLAARGTVYPPGSWGRIMNGARGYGAVAQKST